MDGDQVGSHHAGGSIPSIASVRYVIGLIILLDIMRYDAHVGDRY